MTIKQERALAHTYLKQAWFRLCVFDPNTSSAVWWQSRYAGRTGHLVVFAQQPAWRVPRRLWRLRLNISPSQIVRKRTRVQTGRAPYPILMGGFAS